MELSHFDDIEVDVVLQHAIQRVVFVLDGGGGFVEHVADVVLEVLERRHPVACLIDPALVLSKSGLAQIGTLAVEFVGQALDKQHAENEFLELARVHFAAQDVGGLEQKTLKLREGDFFLKHG